MIIDRLHPKKGAGIFGSLREYIVVLNVFLEIQVLSKTFTAVKHKSLVSCSSLSFLNIYLEIFCEQQLPYIHIFCSAFHPRLATATYSPNSGFTECFSAFL
jgi:hypothetical protein